MTSIRRHLRHEFALSPGPNSWGVGLRLAAAFILPIAVGVVLDRTLTGLFVGIGAFMVANADLGESLRQRARLMVPSTVAIAGLVAAGMVLGANDWLAVPIGAGILVLAGLSPAVGREAALFGTFAAFAYIIGIGISGAPGLDVAEVFWPLIAGGAYALLLSAIGVIASRPGPDEPDEDWRTLSARVRSRVDAGLVRHAAALAIAGSIALVVVPFTEQANGAWLVTGALIVLKPGYRETARLATTRVIGTVAGAVLAGVVAALTSNPIVLLAAALLLTWLAEAVIRRSFGLFVVLITPLSVLLTNVLVPGDWQIAMLRVADVAAGSFIAMVVAALLLPRRSTVAGAESDRSGA